MILTLTALHLKKKLICTALLGSAALGAGMVAGAALTACAISAQRDRATPKTPAPPP